MDRTINILFIAAEAEPFVKVGGLGDVAGSLPLALRYLPAEFTGSINLDVRLVLPFHRSLSTEDLDIQRETVFTIPRAEGSIPVQVSGTNWRGLPIYLVSGDPITKAQSVYSMDPLIDGEKFTYFSIAAVEFTRHLEWRPHIIHANDWHTAPAVYSTRLRRGTDSFFAPVRTTLSVHNLGFMGAGSETALTAYGLPPISDNHLPAWAHHQPFPMGLWSADHIVAVSPSYAEEIMTPEFGYGLEDFLRYRSDTVTGIINGLDYQIWDPESDASLPEKFTQHSLDLRTSNKEYLQNRFGLKVDKSIPLLAMVTRMDQQKGVDLALGALRQVIDLQWQAILLGTGDSELEVAARKLEAEFPQRVCAVIRYDAKVARQLYGGADLMLMPSRYEPCGLTQMIAMRYGCVPLVRATGGLRDTVIENETGYLFSEPTSFALAEALRRALAGFKDRQIWRKYQIQGMTQDFSWQQSARKYLSVYKQLLDGNGSSQ